MAFVDRWEEGCQRIRRISHIGEDASLSFPPSFTAPLNEACNNREVDELGIRAKLELSTDRLHELGVKSLSLFGSGATGKARADSDLDFLVEYDGVATFDKYMGLKELLEREFETSIDLVTIRALKPLIRDRILAEAIKVA